MYKYLFPDCCPVCMEPVLPKGSLIHKECEKKLCFIDGPFCIRCGRPIASDEDAYCDICRHTESFYDMGRCTFPYRTVISTALKEVKNNGTREFTEFFGRTAVKRHEAFLKTVRPEVIVPVPLSRRKLLYRGFNQSELIADVISKRTGIPVMPLLKKIRVTKEQKNLSGTERADNLKGAFSVQLSGRSVIPSSVMLVDDIFTTGSTMNACACVLKQAGVVNVYFICIAAGSTDD